MRFISLFLEFVFSIVFFKSEVCYALKGFLLTRSVFFFPFLKEVPTLHRNSVFFAKLQGDASKRLRRPSDVFAPLWCTIGENATVPH